MVYTVYTHDLKYTDWWNRESLEVAQDECKTFLCELLEKYKDADPVLYNRVIDECWTWIKIHDSDEGFDNGYMDDVNWQQGDWEPDEKTLQAIGFVKEEK